MSELPTSVRPNQSVLLKLKEAVQELREELSFDREAEERKLIPIREKVDDNQLINKQLTHLVFRLASNIQDLQKQIDDVKEDFKTNSDRVIIEVVGKIREDLDGYLDGQYTSDSTTQITN